MTTWQVRQEGAPTAISVSSLNEVVAGLRDEIWLPTDEVKGPTDTRWRPIENHPALEDVVEELEPPPAEEVDETHLDMNPLIDVCLVLLIFFILTITYESLERTIEVPKFTAPEEKKDEKGKKDADPEPIPKLTLAQIMEKMVVITAMMEDKTVVIKVNGKQVSLEKVETQLKEEITAKGRDWSGEVVLYVDGAVPWGIHAGILDAAKANRVQGIVYPAPIQ